MEISQAILDDLTAKAKASERLRMNLNLRDSVTDDSQRMLNAIEPGSTLPIHRHQKTSSDMAGDGYLAAIAKRLEGNSEWSTMTSWNVSVRIRL